MKKLFKVLSLGLLITLAGCSTDGGSTSEPNSEPPSSSVPAPQDSDGTVLKKIAEDMFEYAGVNNDEITYASAKRALDSLEDLDESHRGPELRLPAVLVYYGGVLADIDGVDITSKVLNFTGVCEAKFGPEYQDLTLNFDINAKMDRTNNKVFFSCRQAMTYGAWEMPTACTFVDISYNFATKTLGDFKMYMDQGAPTEYSRVYYFEVVGGQAAKIGSGTNATDIAEIEGIYDTYLAEFNALTKVNATGALATSCTEAYVRTQIYGDRLYGQDSQIRMKQAA